jgi:hypothetical protein
MELLTRRGLRGKTGGMKTRALHVRARVLLLVLAAAPLFAGCASDPYKDRYNARQPASAPSGRSPGWWPLYDSWWPF